MKSKFLDQVINNPKTKYFVLGIFIILHILTYLPLLVWGVDLQVDVGIVLDPIENTSGLKEFFLNIVNLKYFDLNPIRDISHYLDFQLASLFDLERIRIALLHNYLLFIAILINFYFLIAKLTSKKVAFFISILAAFHPLFSNIVFIETWRKHLLAAFFTIVAINLYLYFDIKKFKTNFTFSFFYLVGLLSLPIHILFPFFFLFYDYKFNNINLYNSIKRLTPIFTFSAIIGIANIFYYNTTYQESGFGTKFLHNGNLGDILLSWGRSIIQVVYPVKYAIFYDNGSFENLIGIGVLIFFIYFVLKLKENNISFLILLLYSLSYFTVTHRPTNQFIFDAYLIYCALSFLLFLGFLSHQYKILRSFFLPLALLLCVKTSFENKIKTNYTSFFRVTYNREPACQISNEFMRILLEENDIKTFKEVGELAQSKECSWLNKYSFLKVNMIYKYYLFYNDLLSIEQKIKFISTKPHLDVDLLLLSLITMENDQKLSMNYLGQYLTQIKKTLTNIKFSKIRINTHKLISKKCKKLIFQKECREFFELFAPPQ